MTVRYVSTAGASPACDLVTAVLSGLAPDGGLYLPESYTPIPREIRGSLNGAAVQQTARRVLPFVFGGDDPVFETVVADALDFPIPLVQISERVHVLELFHGPTLAFKDVGARVMARLMSEFHSEERPLTVLTATSGDTGGAVAHAFHGLPNTEVVVLYPYGQVSRLQELQFASRGGNITAIAITGSFDDCQRLAKEAFQDAALRSRLALTSANSINVGRLLPQVLYYFHALAQLERTSEQVVVSVPCGNFGNLTAGLIAKRHGLPVDHYVAATNVNDVVPRYLETGNLSPRPSERTISSAMDVGSPSNLDRIRVLYEDDLDALRRDVTGSVHDDDETRGCIRRVFGACGYVLDPHTAVGYLALERVLGKTPDAVGIVLATAHPAKFAEIVEPLIERPLDIPDHLAVLSERSLQRVTMDPGLDDLREYLLG